MSQTFAPHLDRLPEGQRKLWPLLPQVPAQFTLYGGTAIALQLNHRESVDFDFFAFEVIDSQALLNSITWLEDSTVVQRETNTLTCLLQYETPVLVSFFGLPKLKRVLPPLKAADTGLPVACLLDLAGMKMAVVQARALAKDYLDIDILLTAGGLTLSMALDAARQIYGSTFNSALSLKALTFFEDGDLRQLPPDIRQRLTLAASRILKP